MSLFVTIEQQWHDKDFVPWLDSRNKSKNLDHLFGQHQIWHILQSHIHVNCDKIPPQQNLVIIDVYVLSVYTLQQTSSH